MSNVSDNGIAIETTGGEATEEEIATPGEATEEEVPGMLSQKVMEIAVWVDETNPTDEMIERAEEAKSLDSLVIENGFLLHVRTGNPIALYNEETGELFDLEEQRVIAIYDKETGMVMPVGVKPEESEEEPDGETAEDTETEETADAEDESAAE